MTDDNGTDTRRSHLTAREVGYIDGKRDALASAVARGAAHARLVEAARAVLETQRRVDEHAHKRIAMEQWEVMVSEMQSARVELDAALAEVDRGR